MVESCITCGIGPAVTTERTCEFCEQEVEVFSKKHPIIWILFCIGLVTFSFGLALLLWPISKMR